MLLVMASVFSMIISGELPGRFVWQDDDVVAFLTIAPVAAGHTLVVPRQEVDQWQSIDPALFARCNEVAQYVGQAAQSAFEAPRIGMLIAGFEVPHVHLHVFPAWDMSGFNLAKADPNTPAEVMDEALTKLRAALREAGHGEFVPAD